MERGRSRSSSPKGCRVKAARSGARSSPRRRRRWLGINLSVLRPGEPMAMYHWEADQEDFLVLAGKALLIVEGDERPLGPWDFVHCCQGMSSSAPETHPAWCLRSAPATARPAQIGAATPWTRQRCAPARASSRRRPTRSRHTRDSPSAGRERRLERPHRLCLGGASLPAERDHGDCGCQRCAAEAERHVTERVCVGRCELRRVADEGEVLAELPQDCRYSTEAHDERKELRPPDVSAEQRRGDRTAQECPIHEVVRVVPPVDRVVEVECVADRVNEEWEYEERVGQERIGRMPTTLGPDRGHDQSCDRVADEPPAERLPCKALETGEGAKASSSTSETFTARSSKSACVRLTEPAERMPIRGVAGFRLALREQRGLVLLLTPLPLGECSGSLTSLPLFKGAILVVETKVPTGKPPLDGTAEGGASAPAVRVASALPVAGVVDSP